MVRQFYRMGTSGGSGAGGQERLQEAHPGRQRLLVVTHPIGPHQRVTIERLHDPGVVQVHGPGALGDDP